MKLLAEIDCRAWCSERGLRVSEAGYLSYPTGPIHSVVISLPKVGLRAVGLANVLSRNLSIPPPNTSLLWLKDWNIWGEDFEEVGANVFKKMIPWGDQEAEIKKLPGQLFGSTEQLDQRSVLLFPILFQWDAYLVPDHANHLIFVCHDGFVNIIAKTSGELEHVFAELHAWEPSKVIPKKIKRFVGP